MNETIDGAALKAGRDPAAIRRLYNVSRKASPELLAELALDEGMSGFITSVSSVADVERWAQEVAPATRELVDAERERRASAPPASAPSASDGPASAGHASAGHASAGRASATDDPVEVRGKAATGARHTDGAAAQRSPGAGAHLVEVHDGLRAELGRLRDIVEQVVAGEEQAHRARNAINELTMRQNNWTLGAYCAQYCRFVTGHHTLEDRSVFPHLRRSEPALAPVLDRLEAEHVVIHDVLEQLDEALVGLVSGASGTAELQRVVELLSRTLLDHLTSEEDDLVPALDRHGFA
jgi:hemerythrin superfamily protein